MLAKKTIILTIFISLLTFPGLFLLSNYGKLNQEIKEKILPPGQLSRLESLGKDKVVFLRSTSATTTSLVVAENNSLRESPLIYSPTILKKDKKGQIWAAGLAAQPHKGEIILSEITNNSWSRIPLKIKKNKIIPQSLDFDFDLFHHPLFSWLEKDKDKIFIHAYLTSDSTHWPIVHPSLNSSSSPLIHIDRFQRIWIFWVGHLDGQDDIYATYFDGLNWSTPLCLTETNPYPDLLPQVKEDDRGHIWLVWTGYDGQDYEIFARKFEGNQWSKIYSITNNQIGDTSPTLLFSDSIPYISWIQPSPKSTSIIISVWQGNKWSDPCLLYQAPPSTWKIEAIENHHQINLLLSGLEKNILLTFSSFNLITGLNQKKTQLDRIKAPKNATISRFNPELKENSYLGFGNSITYGYLDYQEAPDLGYIPRLQALLINEYGDGQVINEGWPGETTIGGVSRIEEVLLTHQAQYLLLMEGTNDIIFKEISTATSEFNLKEMVRKSKEHGVYVIITTIIPRNDWRWKRVYYRERIYDLNDRIRSLAAAERIPLIDFFNLFYNYPEEEGGWTSLLSSDKVHPSEKGYQLMAENWFQEIKLTPFPPQEVQVFRIRDGVAPVPHTANAITWQNSKKLEDESNFLQVKIYRRERNKPSQEFELIKTLPFFSKEFKTAGLIGFPSLNNFGSQAIDLTINPQLKYEYVLTILRKDLVEGPPCLPATEKTAVITLKKKITSSPQQKIKFTPFESTNKF